jgi:hypothetical protein
MAIFNSYVGLPEGIFGTPIPPIPETMKIMILGFTMIYHTLVAGLQVQSPETHGYHQKNGTAKITPSHRFQSLLLGQNPLPPGLLW